MQIKDVEKLKAWLFQKLEPLCDADPAALSKYVVALLRKEKPKAALKELCIDQLEVFLAKETVAFVDKLFRSLESESYLNRDETPPPSPPKPQPPPSNEHNVARQQSEDTRQKEVDDEDRDFRRSKRNDSEGDSDQPKKPADPTSKGEATLAGKKRKNEDSGISTGIKRRVIDIRPKPADSASSPVVAVGVPVTTVTSSEPPTAPVTTITRRPVRERLGPRPTEERSIDVGRRGGRRYHRGHTPNHTRSASSSSSSSSDDGSSGSESDSSSGSSVGGAKHSRKRKKRVHPKEVKKRQRCKDYDEKGFCILGENCPFDHGVDPLVIGGGINPYPLGLPPPPGLPPLPPLGKPNLLVRPLLPPVLPPRTSPPPPTTSTDGYNPEAPALTSSSRGFIPTPIIPPHPVPLPQRFPPPTIRGIAIPPPPSMMSLRPPPHLTASTTLTASTNFHHQMRPRPPTHFGGRGPMKPSDTLIIRKIPRDLNTVAKLSSHFEKFGTVVNLTVRYEGDPEGALVQFSHPVEAKKAHSSTEAVLNNRFIRIYFLRKDHISVQVPLTEVTLESPASVAITKIHGAPPLGPAPVVEAKDNAMTKLVEEVKVEESENHLSEETKVEFLSSNVQPHPPVTKTTPSPTSPSAPPHSYAPPPPQSAHQRRKSAEAAKKKLELQKKTHELLQKQIQQQKLLITKLEKSGKHLSAEEKETIMKSLKTLSGSISKLKEAAAKTVAHSSKPEPIVQKSAPTHLPTQQKQTTAELKAKAEALRKQAHMLGLLSSPSQPLPPRGKGNEQGHDLRVKLSKQRQLLVMNVTDRDELISYFDSFGGLEGVEVDPSNSSNLIFTFRSRSIANQVVNKGSVLNGKPLIMKWYTPKPRAPHPTLPTVAMTTSKTELPHHQISADVSKPTSLEINTRRVVVETQLSSDDQVIGPTTPTLTKLDPEELHLVDDSDEEEGEGRSWRR